MRAKEILDRTTDNRTYKLTLKMKREADSEIRCSRCPYHRRENFKKIQRTWKRYRRTQYKEPLDRGTISWYST